MFNDVFDKSAVLLRAVNTAQNVSAADEMQNLSGDAADAKRGAFFAQVRNDFQDQFLECLVDRHDQSCCDQVTGDGITGSRTFKVAIIPTRPGQDDLLRTHRSDQIMGRKSDLSFLCR